MSAVAVGWSLGRLIQAAPCLRECVCVVMCSMKQRCAALHCTRKSLHLFDGAVTVISAYSAIALASAMSPLAWLGKKVATLSEH